MAGLAIHVSMLAFTLCIENVSVAGLAGFMAGKFDRTCRNLGNRISTIVTVLAEAFGDNVAPNDKKDNESENEESCESE